MIASSPRSSGRVDVQPPHEPVETLSVRRVREVPTSSNCMAPVGPVSFAGTGVAVGAFSGILPEDSAITCARGRRGATAAAAFSTSTATAMRGSSAGANAMNSP